MNLAVIAGAFDVVRRVAEGWTLARVAVPDTDPRGWYWRSSNPIDGYQRLGANEIAAIQFVEEKS